MYWNTFWISIFLTSLLSLPSTFSETGKRPNVVFILTDDQDAKLNSLDYMPQVQKHLIEKGTHFQRHYCTVAWCCPSRVSLWTGKAAHNTNVTNVEIPYGGYPKFVDEGHNDNWIPVWLQEQGYQTYYVGKLMNAQNVLNYFNPFAKGFTGSDFLLDPNTYNYMNPIFQRNKQLPSYHKDEYSTDLVHNKSIGFLEDALQNPNSPFFLTIAPIAPHSDYTLKIGAGDPPIGISITPPVSAPRHQSLFPDEVVPRGPSFNPDVTSGVDWIAGLPKLSAENITYNDHLYRQRLRALQAVDEIVEHVVQKLEDAGELENTYIFYAADNGYHISQHRLPPGKGCGFEEDINVPLIVRGPNVPAGKAVKLATSHTDLAPTWFEILGIPLRDEFDGKPIPLTQEAIDELERSGKAKEHIQIEFWANATRGEYGDKIDGKNTYKALRIVGEDGDGAYGFYYSVWCTGSHELYDMKRDPSQMRNLFSKEPYSNTTIALSNSTYLLSSLTNRLDALLLVLKTCKSSVCTEPWESLLPGARVNTLLQVMSQDYDEYFAGLPKVEYERCEEGYIADAEGEVWDDSLAEGFMDVHRLARKTLGRGLRNRP